MYNGFSPGPCDPHYVTLLASNALGAIFYTGMFALFTVPIWTIAGLIARRFREWRFLAPAIAAAIAVFLVLLSFHLSDPYNPPGAAVFALFCAPVLAALAAAVVPPTKAAANKAVGVAWCGVVLFSPFLGPWNPDSGGYQAPFKVCEEAVGSLPDTLAEQDPTTAFFYGPLVESVDPSIDPVIELVRHLESQGWDMRETDQDHLVWRGESRTVVAMIMQGQDRLGNPIPEGAALLVVQGKYRPEF